MAKILVCKTPGAEAFAAAKPTCLPSSTLLHPLSFEDELRLECLSIIRRAGWQVPYIELVVEVGGICPLRMQVAVLRALAELVGNAVEHGFYGRSSGRIAASIEFLSASVRVSVCDDGWGFPSTPIIDGNGFATLRMFGVLALSSATGLDGAAQVVLELTQPDKMVGHRRRLPVSRGCAHA